MYNCVSQCGRFYWDSKLTGPTLVRGGQEVILPDVFKTGEPLHTRRIVYGEMLLQICADYSGLPDPRTLELEEIEFFYDGLRARLIEDTRPK